MKITFRTTAQEIEQANNVDISKIKNFKVVRDKDPLYKHILHSSFKFDNVSLKFRFQAFNGKNQIGHIYEDGDYEKNAKKLEIATGIEKIQGHQISIIIQRYVDKYVKKEFSFKKDPHEGLDLSHYYNGPSGSWTGD